MLAWRPTGSVCVCLCVRWFSDPLKWWGSLLLAAGAETAVRCRVAVIRCVLQSVWPVCGCERLCVNVSVFSSISHTVLISMPCTSVCPPLTCADRWAAWLGSHCMHDPLPLSFPFSYFSQSACIIIHQWCTMAMSWRAVLLCFLVKHNSTLSSSHDI